MLIFCDFIQVYVFTTNHHLNLKIYIYMYMSKQSNFKLRSRMTNMHFKNSLGMRNLLVQI